MANSENGKYSQCNRGIFFHLESIRRGNRGWIKRGFLFYPRRRAWDGGRLFVCGK